MADVNVNARADQAPTMAPPTHTVDQILPHIIWEEFTRSIHTFTEDKKNLTQHTQGKKKATLIMIPSVRFTKLIIYYLQSKHKFHPRPDSSLHLPNEEPVLGYLKFSAKGTKWEVFGMPILNELITADIQEEQYNKEYLEKVAKHQRYLVGEEGSDPDSPLPKPDKATKKSKPLAPKADLSPPVIKTASSQHPKPKPAPIKSQEKKYKVVTETSDKPSPAKRSKPGLVTKRRKPTSSLRSVDESVDEGIPEKEPRFDDEEADLQRAVEESLKSVHYAPRGLLPLVVIREPDSGKFQLLLEVQGTRKEKVSDEQVARDLLTLQTLKKKSPADHDVEFDEEVPGIDARVQDEGQAGSNPGEQDEGQARPNPGDAAASQPQSSPVVHAGPNLKHIDLEAMDVSTQPHPKPMDEGDLFFNDKPSEADNEKTTVKTEAESMVSVTIRQDTFVIPPMTPIINLTSRPDSLNVSKSVDEIVTDAVDWAIQAPLQNRFRDLPEADMKEILHQRMWETNSYKAHEDHMMLYEALKKSMNRDYADELLKDLAEACRKENNRRDSSKTPPGSPPHQPPSPPPPAGPSGTSGSPGAFGSSQVLPPPPPPSSTNQEGQSYGSTTPSSSKIAALTEYTAWTTTDTRLRPFVSSIPKDLHMDEDMAPNAQAHSSDDEDIVNAHIPKASALASTYTPPPEDSLLAQTGDMAMFMDWFCKRQGITELKPQDLEGPTFELVKVFHPNFTILSDFFFNKDLEYLRYGSKGSRPALTILKMKAAYYPDVGLEQMVPDQMWIEEECKYDIAAIQRVEDLQLGIESYQNQLNLTKPQWDATSFEYKHDFTVIDSPRAIIFRDKYGVQMIMRFNEIHKFSDDTLHQIDEALDYRVNEFKVNKMNLGLNTRFWTRKYVDRSKEFMFAI
uniref:E-beta-farnesene synthase n=1 Tax=Tanacetum cinerariifolium TaxID=118510 RepID=A0A6L2P2H5_TANCI|nr:E-beta-farnesene synthase [Tanacetum cinerariifolium]